MRQPPGATDGTPWTTGHHPTALWITGILIPWKTFFFFSVHNFPTRELDDHFPKWYKMIHAEFFSLFTLFSKAFIEKTQVFSPMSAAKVHRSPQELSQLDRAGDLYDSIAERLYTMPWQVCLGSGWIWKGETMVIYKDAESTMLDLISQSCEKPELYEAYVLCQLVSYTCSILGFVDGCPPQGWSPGLAVSRGSSELRPAAGSTQGRNLKSRSRRHRSHLKSMVFEVFRSFDRFSLQEDATVPRNTIWKPPHWG